MSAPRRASTASAAGRAPRRRPATYGLCAALLLLAVGCGDGDDGPPPPATATATATAGATASTTSTASAVPTEVATAPPTPTAAPPPTATDAPASTATPLPTAPPTATPRAAVGPLAMRRLTEAQYRASIADVLGADLVVAGRIEPDNRRSGLLAVGASYVSVTAAGFEQYEAIARNVAAQALDPAHRAALVPCVPLAATQADDPCAEQFLRLVGGRLLRRPLDDADLAPRLRVAAEAAAALGDFYAGLESALTTLLLAPEFLFRVEIAEADPAEPARPRLDDLSLASRLGYLLWDTTPDDELLAAAQRGELGDDDGLARQVDRLLDSPRLEDAVRALFSDLYGFEEIEQGLVRKDPALFPAFNQALINDAREQTLRVIADHLLAGDGDYRDLFTTRQSFMTRALGVVYRVPVRQAVGWEAFEFPTGGERAGLLTHVSILALRSHPGRSSPTLRGKFVREVLLCQDVPPPPGDIDFSMFAEEGGANRRTARERLTVHVTNEICAGCHSLMDPIGLALEQLDGIGAYREVENGATIDASGELDGVPYGDAIGLGEVLSRHPALGPCFLESVYRYALGRDLVAGDRAVLDGLQAELEVGGYRLRDLLRGIALSEPFRATSGAREAEATPLPTLPAASPSASAPPTAGTPPPTPTPRGTGSVDPSPTATQSAVSFQTLQDEILTPRCATQFCHSQQTHSGDLILESGAAYDALVGVPPSNAAARAAGWLRVDPYDPAASFLLTKLTGPMGGAFGARMPLIGSPLDEQQIGMVRDWILEGAQP